MSYADLSLITPTSSLVPENATVNFNKKSDAMSDSAETISDTISNT